jgi:hypothetical protein
MVLVVGGIVRRGLLYHEPAYDKRFNDSPGINSKLHFISKISR